MVDPGSRIANTMAARHDELPTIVAVDDTPEILDLLTMVLRRRLSGCLL